MKRKKILLVYSDRFDEKVAIGIKSGLYLEFEERFPLERDEFIIDEMKEQLDLLEKLQHSISTKLSNREEPSKPKIFYVPEEKMYREMELWGTKYRFLQSDQFDNWILQLLAFKHLLKKCILTKNSLYLKFIERNSDAFHSA